MEDAAALSVVLPKGTAPEDVPERLKLYEKIRYERAHKIQDYSRQAGKDWIDGKPQIDSKCSACSTRDQPANMTTSDELYQLQLRPRRV